MLLRPQFWALTCGVLLSVLTATPLCGIYVDPVNGDDANDGGSWDTALKTLTRAALIGDGRAPLYLAEGVLSDNSGEVFPIYFRHAPPAIIGVSSDATVIDAGTSSTIISELRRSDCTFQDLTFRRSADEGTPADAGPMIWLEIDEKVRMTRVRFEGYRSGADPFSDDHPIIALTGDWLSPPDFSLFDCVFSDCDALWLAGDSVDFMKGFSKLTMDGCLFKGNFYRDAWGYYEVGFDITVISNCRFLGSDAPSEIIFMTGSWPYSSGSFAMTNCLFDTFQLHLNNNTHQSWDNVVGCSFLNSEIKAYYSIYGQFLYCAFDSLSGLFVPSGGAELRSCCVAFTPDDSLYLTHCILEDPKFADGALGGGYLSARESGQPINSRCLSLIATGYSGWEGIDWPTEGSTTRTDGVPDEAPYDIGYHYPSVPPPPPAAEVRTDRTRYAAGEEMTVYPSYNNRGVKVEGAIYFAFGPESLDWLIYWPWMTFVPTPWVEGTLYSGVSYPNLPPTTHTIPEGLTPGHYLWLGAVLNSDGAFASDIALWPVAFSGCSIGPSKIEGR